MQRTFRYVLLLGILSLISATAAAQSGGKNEEALRSLVKRVADAQVAWDAIALDSLFAADYIEISPAGEFDPREKVLGFYKPELKPPAGTMPNSIEVDEFSI